MPPFTAQMERSSASSAAWGEDGLVDLLHEFAEPDLRGCLSVVKTRQGHFMF